ncbi:hypothetical protein FKM82_030357 [Ascaphus truei]
MAGGWAWGNTAGIRGATTRNFSLPGPVPSDWHSGSSVSGFSGFRRACCLFSDPGNLVQLLGREDTAISLDSPPSCVGFPTGTSSSRTTSATGSDGSALRSVRAWARPFSAVATTGACGG